MFLNPFPVIVHLSSITFIGMVLGTAISPEHIGLAFSVILSSLLFTACLYYPWASLSHIVWFQIVTLFNPLTYAAEGLRYAMTPVLHGQSTLPPIWSLIGLSVSGIFFFFISLSTFRRRVIS